MRKSRDRPLRTAHPKSEQSGCNNFRPVSRMHCPGQNKREKPGVDPRSRRARRERPPPDHTNRSITRQLVSLGASRLPGAGFAGANKRELAIVLVAELAKIVPGAFSTAPIPSIDLDIRYEVNIRVESIIAVEDRAGVMVGDSSGRCT